MSSASPALAPAVAKATAGRNARERAQPCGATPQGTASDVLVFDLQRGIGNHAVTRLLLAREPALCSCACAGNSGGGKPSVRLPVGPLGDALEREAERVADRVTRAGSAAPPPEQPPVPLMVQRLRDNGPRADETVAVLPTGGARPLSAKTRAIMESRFGIDFGHVRLHTGAAAEAVAGRLHARAFTYGPDIWLGRGASEGDLRLMAHELTHVVQLGRARRLAVLRQPRQGAQVAPVRQAGPAEQREFLQEMIRYLRSATEYWRLARVDQATLDRVLTSWQTMATEGERLAGALGDDALRTELRQAYTGALRALMSRAAGQLHRPAIRLYLENIQRIFDWAWPRAGAFPIANEAQRRRLVQETIDALNAVAFSGFTQFSDATLIDVLTRLRNLVDEKLQIIATQLGGDQALRDGLRAAYVSAIRDLLPRAAASMGTNAELLYLRFRYGPQTLIPDWADQQVAGITTPLPPVGAAPDPITGEVTMTINGVRVIFEPDGAQPGTGASTNIHFNFNNAIQWQTQGGHVTGHQGPGVPEARVRTDYGPGASAASQSGYGRGTTAADIAAGQTTIGFHEGSHGRDYLFFLVNNAFPAFTGAEGQTVHQFQQAVQQYTAACTQYSNRIKRFSELQTDCVGITIVDYYAAQGQHSPVVCP